MRSRFFVFLSTIFILVLAVPVAAGGVNDDGNGYRVVYDADYTTPVGWRYPICDGGNAELSGSVTALRTVRDTLWEKADGSGEKWVFNDLIVFETIRHDVSERRVTNSIDPVTGTPNALIYSLKVTWSDESGVYATQDYALRRTWDAFGNLKHDQSVGEPGTRVCLRDTILP